MQGTVTGADLKRRVQARVCPLHGPHLGVYFLIYINTRYNTFRHPTPLNDVRRAHRHYGDRTKATGFFFISFSLHFFLLNTSARS
jgi:hypothetical protein